MKNSKDLMNNQIIKIMMEKIICLNMIKEVLHINNNYDLYDLKTILNLEIFRNNLKGIKIKDVYYHNIYNADFLNLENKDTSICIKNHDKYIIENLILNFMVYNIKYKFEDIKRYIQNNFDKYSIRTCSLSKLLVNLKNKGLLIYIKKTKLSHKGYWIKI